MVEVEQQLVGELFQEVCVAVLQNGELQYLQGFLVVGIFGPQDQPTRPFLYLLQLATVGEGKG